MLKTQGQSKIAKSMTKKSLKSLYDIVETRIPQIDTELANLKTEIAAAQAVVKQVTKSISKAESQYEKVETGKTQRPQRLVLPMHRWHPQNRLWKIVKRS